MARHTRTIQEDVIENLRLKQEMTHVASPIRYQTVTIDAVLLCRRQK